MRRADQGRVVPGTMRQRIRIEEPVRTPDGQGGFVTAWQEVATLWAKMEALRGDERIAAGQLGSQIIYRFRLRWREDITAHMRVVFGVRVFAIHAVLAEEGRRRSLVILAEEGVGS